MSSWDNKYNSSDMQLRSDGHYYKGYFLNNNENELCNIINPEWDFTDEQDEMPGYSYEDASVFRMGSCQLFSLALAKRFGYEAFEAIGEDGRLIHAFCKGNYLGRDVYIDVRGSTSNWDMFLLGYPIRSNEIVRLVNQQIDSEPSTEDEVFGYRFACWIIENYTDIYTI